MRTVQLSVCMCRYFSMSSAIYKNRSHQARVLNKLLERAPKSNKFLPHVASVNSVDSHMKEANPHVLRRVTVLNKVYMEYVTQIINSCAIYVETVGEPIEISHVRITNDFKTLNIYWFLELAKQNETPVVEKRLQLYAKELRYKLAQARVIGNVPIVQFVRNKNITAIYEVEQRLAKADFGEGYQRNSVFLNSERPVTYSTVKSNEKDKKQSVLENDDKVFSVTLPAMRHDVFGLDHARIMNQIRATVKRRVEGKSKKLNTDLNPNNDSVSFPRKMTFLTDKEQEIKFKKFLLERKKQIQQKHAEAKSAFKTQEVLEEFEDDDDYFVDEEES